MLTPSDVTLKMRRLRQQEVDRDQRMHDVRDIRSGRIPAKWMHLVSEQFPEPVVANFIDVAARDLAASSSDVPSITCASSNMTTDTAKARAQTRTKIANQYVAFSNLEVRLPVAADHYYTYGFCVVYVEPDFDEKMPRITVEDPTGGYPECNRWGKCISYTKVVTKTVGELVALFPDYERELREKPGGMRASDEEKLELVRYCDAEQVLLYVPDRRDLVLAQADSPTPGECPVRIGWRYSLSDGDTKGQFDDVIPVQMARAYFAALTIEAAEEAIQAPIALPDDVDELSLGPNAVLRSSSPEKIHRVNLELPPSALQEGAALREELQIGAGSPEARTGNVQASVITGQGVDALMAGYNSQVAIAQRVLGLVLKEAIGLAFQMDEHLWGGTSKRVQGVQDGTPYQLTYTPKKDIAGDYTVDVQYGMLGMDRNRALVFLLQALGAGLVSKEFVVRQLPFPVDVVQEAQQRDVEGLREALLQSIAQMPMAVPQMAMQGADPTAILKQIADIIHARQQGESLESAVEKALAPPPAPDQGEEAQEDPTGMPGAPEAPQGPPGGMPAMPGGGGGQPALQTLLAGLSNSGSPQLGANVKRQIPTPT